MATDEFFRCAGCQEGIKTSSEAFLIRLNKYWHENCFCCKICNLPIPNFRYYAFVDHTFHESCYKKLYKSDGSDTKPKDKLDASDAKPKDHIVSDLRKNMAAMMKRFSWGIGKGHERKSQGDAVSDAESHGSCEADEANIVGSQQQMQEEETPNPVKNPPDSSSSSSSSTASETKSIDPQKQKLKEIQS